MSRRAGDIIWFWQTITLLRVYQNVVEAAQFVSISIATGHPTKQKFALHFCVTLNRMIPMECYPDLQIVKPWAFERGSFNGVDIHLSLTLTVQLNQAEAGKLSLYAVFCIILVQLHEGVDVQVCACDETRTGWKHWSGDSAHVKEYLERKLLFAKKEKDKIAANTQPYIRQWRLCGESSRLAGYHLACSVVIYMNVHESPLESGAYILDKTTAWQTNNIIYALSIYTIPQSNWMHRSLIVTARNQWIERSSKSNKMWAIQWPYIFNSDIISRSDVIPLRSYTNALIAVQLENITFCIWYWNKLLLSRSRLNKVKLINNFCLANNITNSGLNASSWRHIISRT